ncbi:MAG: serine protease [Deltaproteobacteria bacterium]|nr:serine protease [Deltaproteobacteria bacterium]
MTPRISLALIALAATACAKAPLLDPKLPAPESAEGVAATATTSPEESLPKGSVARPYVDHVLREGPGWLLEKVPVEEVVTNGKFIGWRVRELPADWSGGDLRVGDVVTRVNEKSLETPNDFWAAWSTLGVASSIAIDYLRGQEARVVTVPIVGKPDPAATNKLGEKAAPTSRPPRDRRFETVVIEGDPISSSPPVDWTTN